MVSGLSCLHHQASSAGVLGVNKEQLLRTLQVWGFQRPFQRLGITLDVVWWGLHTVVRECCTNYICRLASACSKVYSGHLHLSVQLQLQKSCSMTVRGNALKS